MAAAPVYVAAAPVYVAVALGKWFDLKVKKTTSTIYDHHPHFENVVNNLKKSKLFTKRIARLLGKGQEIKKVPSFRWKKFKIRGGGGGCSLEIKQVPRK